MDEKVDQDVREAADEIASAFGYDEREHGWLLPILARMKAAGREQGLREAAEVVMAKAEGVRKKARRDREITDSRCGLVLGYEDAEAAITALMVGEGE